MNDIECPSCKTEFESEELVAGKCPNCGLKYQVSEDCLEDYSDCWTHVTWEDAKM